MYTVSQKVAIIMLPITLPNVDGFREDDSILLSSVTYTVSVPKRHITIKLLLSTDILHFHYIAKYVFLYCSAFSVVSLKTCSLMVAHD